MKLYYADAEKIGDLEKLQYTYDGEFQNQAVVKSLVKKHGYRITRIVPQKGYHRCSYIFVAKTHTLACGMKATFTR